MVLNYMLQINSIYIPYLGDYRGYRVTNYKSSAYKTFPVHYGVKAELKS